MKKKTLRNIGINFLVLFVTVLIVLALVEIVVRVFDLAPQYGTSKMFVEDEILDYRMKPNFTGRFVKHEVDIFLRTNSYGLRDEEYYGKKPRDFNILALGDSFTWGAYGTELKQTYVKLLERMINENLKSRNYRVINAGVPGYGTDQELLYLENYGQQFEPDLVMLSFFVGNDFFDNMQSGEFGVNDGVLVPIKVEQSKIVKFRNFLLFRFRSYRAIERGFTALFGNFVSNTLGKDIQHDSREISLFKKPIDEQTKMQFDKTKKILDEMNSYAKTRNIKFVIIIIPLDYQVNNELKEKFIKDNFKDNNFDIEQPQKVIIEWAKRNNIAVIDLIPELSKSEQNLYWRFNGHFNEKGNEEVANIIHNELIKSKNLLMNNK